MSAEEISESTDFRYIRTGYINQGRPADTYINIITNSIPGNGVLPLRWRWISNDYFTSKYGYLGHVIWAKTASYHLLMVGGNHVLRFWTDSSTTCVVDVNEAISSQLQNYFTVDIIPESCDRKCKPFTKRVRVCAEEEVSKIVESVKTIYGLG